MGSTWYYFKRYEIKPDSDGVGDNIFHYYDGGHIDLSYGTKAQLASILEHYNVCLPVYDWTEPPDNMALTLKMNAFNTESGIGSFEKVNGSTIPSQASLDKEAKHFINPTGKYKTMLVRDETDLIIGVYFEHLTSSALS